MRLLPTTGGVPLLVSKAKAGNHSIDRPCFQDLEFPLFSLRQSNRDRSVGSGSSEVLAAFAVLPTAFGASGTRLVTQFTRGTEIDHPYKVGIISPAWPSSWKAYHDQFDKLFVLYFRRSCPLMRHKRVPRMQERSLRRDVAQCLDGTSQARRHLQRDHDQRSPLGSLAE